MIDRVASGVRRRLVVSKQRRSLAGLQFTEWQDYDGLHWASTALLNLRSSRRAPASLNLVLPDFDEKSLFAGTKTALQFALSLAAALGLPLRIISLGPRAPSQRAGEFLRSAGARSTIQVSVESGWSIEAVNVSDSDIWIATHWITAHALAVACALELISRTDVLYLVQDYEPSFSAASTESALAKATYHSGFSLIYNSLPLAKYIALHEGLSGGDQLTFRPDLDLDGLRRAAAARVIGAEAKVAFYGRPSKPRNAFALGVSAVRVCERMATRAMYPIEFVSIGESHAPVPLGRSRMRSVGKLPWFDYFTYIATVDVVLSLQQTPHPSHPPLDAVASGGWAVTNEFDGLRATLSHRLLAVADDPVVLGDALLRAVQAARSAPPNTELDEEFVGSLGVPMATVVARTAEHLSTL